MRRFFSSGGTVLKKYVSILEKHSDVWHEVFPKQYSEKLRFFPGEKLDNKALDFSLQIMWDLLRRGGKKMRPVMMLMLADIYSVDMKRILPLAFMVETVHNSTLVLDDIEDQSEKRRGEPCVHLKFGIDNAINSGVLGMFLPAANSFDSKEIQSLPVNVQLELYRKYIEEMKNIHLGLAWDIYWHSNKYNVNTIPTEHNYIRMVESKTSVLMRIGFAFVSIAGELPSTEKAKLEKIANYVGTSFQIQDDLINLESLDYAKGRGQVGEDITEGKITLMVIHHVNTTKNQRLLDILSMKTKDESLILEAIRLMVDSGSLKYADNVQKEYMAKAISIVESLNGDESAKKSFKAVLEDLLSRNS
jgi:geranylgeranyl pyrophosphate synthase